MNVSSHCTIITNFSMLNNCFFHHSLLTLLCATGSDPIVYDLHTKLGQRKENLILS
jgi:hypothetical protein